MNDSKHTYVGAAASFDRTADDGWPEDAGLWPIEGSAAHPVQYSHQPLQGSERPSLSERVRSFLLGSTQT